VILGAGFDSRAYRILGIDQTRVFEVDHPATQAKKKDVVTRRLGTLPPHVTLVPIDFATHTLATVMPGSGYRREAKTFFICEGVTHYLSAPAVDAIFRYVARNAAVGSRMVFTYIHGRILDESVMFPGAANTLATVRRAGEPYTFGFDPVELPRYLAARNLILVEDVGASTYRARYLIPLGRGQQPLAEFQRAALVEIAGRNKTDSLSIDYGVTDVPTCVAGASFIDSSASARDAGHHNRWATGRTRAHHRTVLAGELHLRRSDGTFIRYRMQPDSSLEADWEWAGSRTGPSYQG
jgi:Leucine carboxyl methyltransferase